MSKQFVDFEQLKEEVSFEQVLVMLELEMNPSGQQLRGCCPVHKGTNRRDFVITPEKGLWYCFSCRKGGDMINLAICCRCRERI